jgi:hypothetical protein
MKLRPLLTGSLLFLSLLALPACAATVVGRSHPASATTVRVDVSIFYDRLAPYGHWFRHGGYGWVWTPYDMPVGWRPYTHGHWVYSDCGWAWVSDWSWGWAPFHYGRWFFDRDYGWIWIPDTVWGPAWVAWRWSDDWIGWAPLPPDARWQVGIGLHFGDWRDLDDSWWCFTQPRWLLDRNVRSRIEPASRNRTFLPRTKPASDYDDDHGRPRNRGRDVGEIERVTRRSVPRYKVADAPGVAPDRDTGRELRVFRPAVSPAPDRQPPVTPAPAARSADGDRVRRQAEDRKVDTWYQREEQRMESRQKVENRQTPPREAPAVERAHEQERKALDEQRAREQQVREQRVEKRIEKPAPQAPPKSERTPRGKK